MDVTDRHNSLEAPVTDMHVTDRHISLEALRTATRH